MQQLPEEKRRTCQTGTMRKGTKNHATELLKTYSNADEATFWINIAHLWLVPLASL